MINKKTLVQYSFVAVLISGIVLAVEGSGIVLNPTVLSILNWPGIKLFGFTLTTKLFVGAATIFVAIEWFKRNNG